MMDFYEWFERENGITLTDEQRSLLEGSMLKARYDTAIALRDALVELRQVIKQSVMEVLKSLFGV